MAHLFQKRRTKEKDLVARKAIGFEDLLTEHMERLWQVALRLTNYHRDDAKDLLQDAALKAFNHRETLIGVDNPYAWLKRVLVNTYLNRVRDEKKWSMREELDESLSVAGDNFEGTPSSVLDALKTDIWNDDLFRALNALSEENRRLFILSDIEGFTHDELSEMFSMPKGTISSRIYRSRAKLARSLESYAIKHGFITAEKVEAERKEIRQAAAMCPDRAKQEAEVLQRLTDEAVTVEAQTNKAVTVEAQTNKAVMKKEVRA
ncbi:MAG TPA: sigma-70 family RNA polymerase sigma factor [Candidatus Kapabacteria bacterium]|nr:sigma-70 family RNA polymerase sigma factor [Candidatus Kapabacteria bacterium]